MIETKRAKIVYIDQNKLIDLARLKLQADKCETINAYTLLYDLVNQDKIIIPLSFVHIIETTKISDLERRKTFAEFLGQISKGYCFVSLELVQRYEVLHAIKNWTGKPCRIHIGNSADTRKYPDIIGKGLYSLVGKRLAVDKIPIEQKWVVDYFYSSNSIIDHIMGMHQTTILIETQSMECKLIAELEKIRDYNLEFSKEDIFNSNFADFVLETVVPLINDACAIFMIMPSELYDNLDTWDKVKQFFLDIPFVDLSVRLLLDACRQKDRVLSRNDLRDIAFLITAIPYSDVIITEKYWAHSIKKLKMDEKYNTAVFTSIDDAISFLMK